MLGLIGVREIWKFGYKTDNMRKIFIVLALLSAVSLTARERINFDDNWYFTLGHASDYEKDFYSGTEYFNYLTKANSVHNTGPYTDRFVQGDEWKKIDLPHDWAVDLNFHPDASYSHGFKAVGWKFPENSVGWYRKTFEVPESDKGKHIRIQFDGIFRAASIWINGIYIGGEDSGYIHQDYDITDYLLYGKENLVCVRCDASLEEGWFYEGAGIYRHTWLVKSNPLHITTGGNFIHSTLSDNYTKANIIIESEVCNDSNKNCSDYLIKHIILDPQGNEVAQSQVAAKGLKAREKEISVANCELSNPLLWDTQKPNLYRVITQIFIKDKLIYEEANRIGLREIVLDCDKGMFLNGKHIKLKGFNNHQDHAGVGAAIPDGLQRYRIERLKWMGANAYRASHNPMTAELLDICDELGILVFEENRLIGINKYQLDVLENMIKRDRNHPCIFLWGLGNEEWGLEWEQRGTDIVTTMQEYARLVDNTRPIGIASSSGPHILLNMDVAGYNYLKQHPIDEHRANYPKRIALGSEETTACGTRGVYFPTDRTNGRMMSMNFNPVLKDSIGFAMERGLKYYNERPWLLGHFYWTGFDYRGEPVPLSFPATGSQFGVLDYCGFAKDEAYYLKSWWTDEPVLHIMPHWNLEGHEGQTIDTYIFSNCEEVELIVNGKKLGRKKMARDGHLIWKTVYKPGYITAIGYNKGKKIVQTRIETTSEPVNIIADVHKYEDIYVVDISTSDIKNRYVPTANLDLNISVQGDARILGTGNGDSAFTAKERPSDTNAQSFDIQTFNGRAQVILKPGLEPFSFTISGEQLKPYNYNE